MTRLTLADYDPRWMQQFEEHRTRIARAIGTSEDRISHVGSTSVPGLAAKPIIDIVVQGAQADDPQVYQALQSAGYCVAIDEPGHRMYAAADRTAHVHFWSDAQEVERHLIFRDWLRTHPEDAALYEQVKRHLAMREWPTTNEYADAKSAVVDTIMRRARGE